jgi:hypothetical protein
MAQSRSSRFASYGANGKIVALVAEGLPEYPADLSTLSDAEVGELHDAYVEEARLAQTDANLDIARAGELATRIPALRTEAAGRFAVVQAQLDELAALSDEDRAAVVAFAAGVEAAAQPTEEERAAALAALAALDDPAPGTITETGLIASGPMVDPVELSQQMARGVSSGIAAGLEPLVAGLAAVTTRLDEAAARPAAPAVPNRRVSAAELAAFNSRGDDHVDPPGAPAPRGRLVHTGDVQGFTQGAEITDMDTVVEMFQTRYRDLGVSTGVNEEKVLIASYKSNDPDEIRDLRGLASSNDGKELRRRIERVVGLKAIGVDPFNLGRELPIGKGGIAVGDPNAMVASGGLAAPVEPYYPQLLLAEADRPVLGSMPGFVAERGGIRLVLPASLGTLTSAVTPGLFTDGVTDDSTGFTSATAAFTSADVNKPIVQSGGTSVIPAGTVIVTVTNGTTVVLSQATTGGSVTGLSFFLPARNPNNLGQAVGVVTAAQDAAGPPNTVKYTYDVPIGVQAEHDVYSVYTSLQFANLTARTFPEQVELNIRLANALAARVADTKALDYITGWSTLLTFAKTFGTARQLLAQFDHLAAYYRNFNRMDPAMVLRLGIPAWAINAMRGDYISTFIGGADNWGLSDDELSAWFQDRHILPFFYWDGPSDISQLFATVGSGAINTGGVNNATPVPVPDYPGQGATSSFRTNLVSFMWAEGTWLGLTTGELNLGLVRDSILNSQNRFRNFEEVWETPAFVGLQSLRTVHTIASDGTYGAAASITLGAGSGL